MLSILDTKVNKLNILQETRELGEACVLSGIGSVSPQCIHWVSPWDSMKHAIDYDIKL